MDERWSSRSDQLADDNKILFEPLQKNPFSHFISIQFHSAQSKRDDFQLVIKTRRKREYEEPPWDRERKKQRNQRAFSREWMNMQMMIN